MNIKEMAEKYRENAEAFAKRINELKDKKSKCTLSYDERYQINKRITELECILAESLRTAYKMETYYKKNNSKEAVEYDNILCDHSTEKS